MEIKMSALELGVDLALTFGYKYFAIKVKMNDFPDDEVIINPIINMVEKLEYWKKTYDDDLSHKYSNGIKIVDYAFGNTYEDIEWVLGDSVNHDDYVEDEE